eukprot:jgi/Galph1/2846/GphlegSOOS_G1532.1
MVGLFYLLPPTIKTNCSDTKKNSGCLIRKLTARKAVKQLSKGAHIRSIKRCSNCLVALAVPAPDALEQFKKAVSGEWKGFEATFDSQTGQVVQVPKTTLPEAFLEWNVSPLGYESYNSVLVRENLLYRKHSRILPSVSFDGDFIDLETETFQYQLQNSSFRFSPNGSYSVGPLYLKQDATKKFHQFELCLPQLSLSPPTRYLCRFSVDNQKCELWGDIQLFLEYFDGNFCDGNAILNGSGFTEGFTSEPLMVEDKLIGTWHPKDLQFLQPFSCHRNSEEKKIMEQIECPLTFTEWKQTARTLILLPGDMYVRTSSIEGQGLDVEIGYFNIRDGWVSLHRTYNKEGQLEVVYQLTLK